MLRRLRSAALFAVLFCWLAASAHAAERFVPIGPGPIDVPGTAEAMDVSADGRTVVYSSPNGEGVYALDITDPTRPRTIGHDGMSATGVALTPDGRYAIAANQAVPARSGPDPDFLRVLDGRTLEELRRIEIAGGDAVKVSPDGRYATIANEQDGGLQDGSVYVLELDGAVADWRLREVRFDAANPAFWGVDNPFHAPGHYRLQPEYVDITANNKAAVAIQEANAIAIVDLPTGTVQRVFSAGSIDTVTDTGRGTPWTWDLAIRSPRFPDALAWLPDGRHLLAASEGEQEGYDANGGQEGICGTCGGRSWTVYDTETGTVAADGGLAYEQLVARWGGYPRTAARAAGMQPEGTDVGTFDGTRYGFVVNERGASMAVLDLTDPVAPRLEQLLGTGGRPEMVAAVPARNLVIASGEKGRGTLSFYRRTATPREDLILPRGAGVGDYLGPIGALGATPDGTFVGTVNSDDAVPVAIALDPTTDAGPLAAPARWVTEPGELPRQTPSDAASDGAGGMWITTTNTLRRVLADGSVGAAVTPPSSGVVGVAVRGDRVYAATAQALLEYDPEGGTWRRFPLALGGPNVIDLDAAPGGRLAALAQTPQGARELWRLGVDGLADGETVTDATRVAALPAPPPDAEQFLTLAVRPDGTVWTGTWRSGGNKDDATPPALTGLRSLGPLLAPADDGPAPRPPFAAPSATPLEARWELQEPVAATLTPQGAYLGTSAAGSAYEQVAGFAVVDAATGKRDTGFPIAGRETNGPPSVEHAVADGAGGVYVAGRFTSFAGQSRSYLVHVLADGTVDPAWPADAPDGQVTAMAVADGRLYLAGLFTHVGETPRQHLAALSLADGRVDPGFDAATDGAASRLLHDGAGALYVVGAGWPVTGGGRTSDPAIAKLDAATGAVDDGFAVPFAGSAAVTTAALADGVLWLAGNVPLADGMHHLVGVSAQSGAPDPALTLPAGGGESAPQPMDLAVAGADLLVAGAFQRLAGVRSPGLALVDRATGAVRASGAPIAIDGDNGAMVQHVTVDGDAVYLGGSFTLDGRGNAPGIARFARPDFAHDPSFAAATPMTPARAVPFGGGKVALAGAKELGRPHYGVFRFDPLGGELDAEFDPQLPLAGSAWRAIAGDDGRLFVGGAANGRPQLLRIDPLSGARVDGFAARPLGSAVSSLALTDDTVYATGLLNGGVQAFDAATGARRTAFAPPLPEAVSALAVLPDGDVLAAFPGDPNTPFEGPGAVVLDGATGDVVRDVPLAAGATRLVVASDGSVHVGRDGGDSLLKLTPGLERDQDFAAGATGTVADLQLLDGRVVAIGPNLLVEDGTHSGADVVVLDADSGELDPLAGALPDEVGGNRWYRGVALPGGQVVGNVGSRLVTIGQRVRRAGDTVTCDTSGVIGSRLRTGPLALQWLRDGAAIAGAESAEYELTAADSGTELSCRITPASGPDLTSDTLAIPAGAPRSSALPSLPSLVRPGEQLTCAGAAFAGAEAIRYRWLRDGRPIDGADARAYRVRDADAGDPLDPRAIACIAIGVGEAGASPAVSAPAKVRALALAPTAKPSPATAPRVHGSAVEGQTLTCADATWTQAIDSDRVAWTRDGAEVEEGAAYELGAADVGRRIACAATASNALGVATAVSDPVTPVALPRDGDDGQDGQPGPGGPQGPQGPAGPQGHGGGDGPAGSQGPGGSQGAKGERGDAGPAGRDARVTCRLVSSRGRGRGRGRARQRVTCSVAYARPAARRASATLTRGGRVYARGAAAGKLRAVRPIAAGKRYVLVLGSGRAALRVPVTLR